MHGVVKFHHSAFIFFILLISASLFSQSACIQNAAPTYLYLEIQDEGNEANLSAFLYSLSTSSNQPNAIGIEGGLLFVSWGNLPWACYMVTGPDGKASAIFNKIGENYPDGGKSFTYTVTFCPFTANNTNLNAQNPIWLANCARLKDLSGKPITRLVNYQKQISPCPQSGPNKVFGDENHDLSELYSPSTSFITLRNSRPSSQAVAFCWGLAAVFGLLFSALFVSGRNPLYLFDWGATRGVRINRYAGSYTPMTQSVMINPSGALKAVDSMLGAAFGPKGEKKDENDKAASGKKSTMLKILSASKPNQPPGLLSSSVGSLSKGLGNFVNEKFNPFFIGYNEKREPVSVVPLPKVLGSGSSVLGSVVNQAFSGMVNMVITAVPQAIFDRHKTVVGKFGASLSRSAKEQGRELAKSALKAIFNNEGVVSLGESLGLDKYSLGGDVSKSLDSLNAVLSPFFDRLLDDWLGSSQPPRLRSMNGLGDVIGLTLTDYLTGSVKQANILEIMWMQRQLTQQKK